MHLHSGDALDLNGCRVENPFLLQASQDGCGKPTRGGTAQPQGTENDTEAHNPQEERRGRVLVGGKWEAFSSIPSNIQLCQVQVKA